MPRLCARRCLTAFLLVVSLLFSQLALANYVCPGESGAAAMAQAMATGQPCDGMDTAQPSLCRQHTTGATAAVDQLKVPAPSLVALVQVLYVLPCAVATDARDLPLSAKPEVHPPPAPVFLSTLRLRV